MPNTSENPLIIELGRQRSGATYRLTSASVERIRRRFPQVHPTPHNLFIGYDTRDLFEEQHGPMWAQIALLLTGLNPTQIEEAGGICFKEPATGSEYLPEPQVAG